MEWRLLEAFSRCIHPSLRALIRTAISEQPWAFLICLFEWLSPSLWSSCFLWRKPMWKPCMCVNTHPYYVSKWLSAKKKSKKLQSFPSYFSCLSSWAILEQNMYILRIIIKKKKTYPNHLVLTEIKSCCIIMIITVKSLFFHFFWWLINSYCFLNESF